VAVGLGDNTPSKFYLGDGLPSKLYIGDSLFWQPNAFQQIFVDEFSVDGNPLPGWTKLSNANSRAVQGRAAIVSLTNGSWFDNSSYAPPITPPADDVAIRFQITTPVTAAATDNTADLWLRAGSESTINYGVGVSFLQGANRVKILSRHGSTSSTARTSEVAYSMDVDLEFRAVGNTFILTDLSSSTELLRWEDTGQLAMKGPSYRSLRMVLSGNYPLFQKMYSSPSVARYEVGTV
jgi:hypothetical protein